MVYAHTAILSGIYAVIIFAGQFTSPQTVQREYAPRDLINFQLVCRGANDGLFGTIGVVYVAILLVVGIIMTQKSGSMVVMFNESKYIAFAMQNMGFLSIVILPTASVVKAQPGPMLILYGLGLTLAAVVTCCSIIIPKLQLIKTGVVVTLGNTANRTGSLVTAKGTGNSSEKSGQVSVEAPAIKVREVPFHPRSETVSSPLAISLTKSWTRTTGVWQSMMQFS